MGLLDRLLRVARASLNETLNGAEDPEKLLEQTTADMQENLLQLRQAVAVAIAIAFGLGGRDIASEQIREWLEAFKRR